MTGGCGGTAESGFSSPGSELCLQQIDSQQLSADQLIVGPPPGSEPAAAPDCVPPGCHSLRRCSFPKAWPTAAA